MAYNRLEVDFGIWGTLRKVAFAIIIAVILGGMALLYVPILKQNSRLEKDVEIKRQTLKQQQALCQKYSEEIQSLKSDPEYVEHVAREVLGVAKPNEDIYRFKDSKQDK